MTMAPYTCKARSALRVYNNLVTMAIMMVAVVINFMMVGVVTVLPSSGVIIAVPISNLYFAR